MGREKEESKATSIALEVCRVVAHFLEAPSPRRKGLMSEAKRQVHWAMFEDTDFLLFTLNFFIYPPI